ncbi:MAG TPA: hypothetical protein VL181_00300 [Holophagaceae bacterium]|nr:hypothetical protein [Holophagaceae bacterium]
MRPALLVITSSRSGSSSLAGVMSMLGAALPATLLGAGPGNQRGHFEPQLLLEINDEVLAVHGATYWDPVMVPAAWFGSEEAEGFIQRIAATITEEYRNADLPVIKDPRLCRVAPLYVEALRRLGYEPMAVLPLRHPGESAGSLSHRDGTPSETAELLQVKELLGADRFSRGLRRVWTRYDDLLQDWRGTMERVASGLGFTWPVPLDQAAAEVEGFLAPGLRRFDAAASHAGAGSLAIRIWEALQAGVAGDEASARAELDAVRAVTDELDRLSGPWQTSLLLRAAASSEEAAAHGRHLKRIRRSVYWKLTGPLRLIGRGLGQRPL